MTAENSDCLDHLNEAEKLALTSPLTRGDRYLRSIAHALIDIAESQRQMAANTTTPLQRVDFQGNLVRNYPYISREHGPI